MKALTFRDLEGNFEDELNPQLNKVLTYGFTDIHRENFPRSIWNRNIPSWRMIHSFPDIEIFPIEAFLDWFRDEEIQAEVTRLVNHFKQSNFDSKEVSEREKLVLELISEIQVSIQTLSRLEEGVEISKTYQHQASILLENLLLTGFIEALREAKPGYLNRIVVLHDTSLRDYFQSVMGKFVPMAEFRKLAKLFAQMNHPASFFQAGWGAAEELNNRPDLVDYPVMPGRTFAIVAEEYSRELVRRVKRAGLRRKSPEVKALLKSLMARYPQMQPYRAAEEPMSDQALETALAGFEELAQDTEAGKSIRRLYKKGITGLWRGVCATTLNPVPAWGRAGFINHSQASCGLTDGMVFDADDRFSVLSESCQMMREQRVKAWFSPNIDCRATDAVAQFGDLVKLDLETGASSSTHAKDASSHIALHPDFIVKCMAEALRQHENAGVKRRVGFHGHNPSGRLEASCIYAALVAGPDQEIMFDTCAVPSPEKVKGHALAQADTESLASVFAKFSWLGDWQPTKKFHKGMSKFRGILEKFAVAQQSNRDNYIDFTTERRLMLARLHLAGGWATVFVPKVTHFFKFSILKRFAEERDRLMPDGQLSAEGYALRDQVYDLACYMVDTNWQPLDSPKRVTPKMNQAGDFGLNAVVKLFEQGKLLIRDGQLISVVDGEEFSGIHDSMFESPDFLAEKFIVVDLLLWSQSHEMQRLRPNVDRSLVQKAVLTVLYGCDMFVPDLSDDIVCKAIPLEGETNPEALKSVFGKAQVLAEKLLENSETAPVDLEILQIYQKLRSRNFSVSACDLKSLSPYLKGTSYVSQKEYAKSRGWSRRITNTTRALEVCFPNLAGDLVVNPKFPSMGANAVIWLRENWHEAKYDPSGILQAVVMDNYGLDVHGPWPVEVFGKEPKSISAVSGLLGSKGIISGKKKRKGLSRVPEAA